MCNFCEGKIPIIDKLSGGKYGDISLEFDPEKNHIQVWDDLMCVAFFEINYCPVCGKKIRKEEKRRMSEWISVKDKMPEEHEDKINEERIDKYSETVLVVVNFDKKRFIGFDHTNEGHWFEYSSSLVSHWMPLPKLPEVEE